MTDVKGLYYYKNYLLIQMGVNSNRARDRFYLSYANYVSEKRLEERGWKRCASKHLAVWDE